MEAVLHKASALEAFARQVKNRLHAYRSNLSAMNKILQRIEDWRRERRISRLGRQLMRTPEDCHWMRVAIAKKFNEEIRERSPEQVRRMDRRWRVT